MEYLENELEPVMVKEMESLLKYSAADRERLAELARARQLIKESDAAVLPEDARYYDRLHDRIMAAIANTDPEGEPEPEKTRDSSNPSGEPMNAGWASAVWNAIALRWAPKERQPFT